MVGKRYRSIENPPFVLSFTTAASMILLILLPLAAFFGGCGSVRTRAGFYGSVSTDLGAQNYEGAVAKIETARADDQYGEKDRFLYYLDSGLVNHYAAHNEESNERLTLAEDAAEELFTKSVSRAAGSLLLNDNVLEYAGEDHEILYTNLIKAINYLRMDSFDDAFVEIRRTHEKLDLLEQKYAEAAGTLRRGVINGKGNERVDLDYKMDRVRFNNDAFARYLSMHIYAAEGKMDDAGIDFEMLRDAFDTQPHIYNFRLPEVRYRSEDRALLSIVALTGLAPVKEELSLRIRTDQNLKLVQILYDEPGRKDAEYGHIPFPVKADYYFKFAIPTIVPRPPHVARIKVYTGSKYLGSLELIEDVGQVALETFKSKRSLIYFRSIARAIVKGYAAHKLKERVDTGGVGGWLKKAAVDVGTEASEGADLRCSRLLPGRIYVGDFEIDEGMHDVRIEYLDDRGAVIDCRSIQGFEVRRDDFNLLESFLLR